MTVKLYSHQEEALAKLKNGSILMGGVGTGKSLTALAYYFVVESGGRFPTESSDIFKEMTRPKDLYIITTARKRDTKEWEKEIRHFLLGKKRSESINNVKVVIDSWNNIKKYQDVKDCFFIFDEQRVVGYGAWSKAFIQISKHNRWILLSATPGDTWSDYIPVFIANGFYKNKTEFTRKHIVYNRFVSYPLIERYVDTRVLERYRNDILVHMPYRKHTRRRMHTHLIDYDKKKYELIFKDRWNPYTDEPVQNASELAYTLRRSVNDSEERIQKFSELIEGMDRVIVFYNFNYELDNLREYLDKNDILYAEWNGHKHEPIPESDKWVYLVQYTSGAEGWNCIDTDQMIFYSLNYSYRMMQQAMGRIDRLNTPYTDLHYHYIRTRSSIDAMIMKALDNKEDFNERAFIKF